MTITLYFCSHGTAIAGLIAGVKGNNFCSVGVAYNATLIAVGLYGSTIPSNFDLRLSRCLSHNSSIVDIYCISRGFDHGAFLFPMGPLTKAAIETTMANVNMNKY